MLPFKCNNKNYFITEEDLLNYIVTNKVPHIYSKTNKRVFGVSVYMQHDLPLNIEKYPEHYKILIKTYPEYFI